MKVNVNELTEYFAGMSIAFTDTFRRIVPPKHRYLNDYTAENVYSRLEERRVFI